MLKLPNDDIIMRAKPTSGNCHQHRFVEVGGVVDRALEVMHLERRDKRAGVSRGLLVPSQAYAQNLVLGGDDSLVE